LEKNGFEPAPNGYLLFFWPERYKERIVNFKTELVEMAVNPSRGREILQQVQEIIKGEKPAVHSQCEYCRYREFYGSN